MWGTDTLIVTGETLLNGDKFFIVASTFMNYNSYFMSNTDIGVWYYDDYGEQSNYLEVKFPVNNNEIYYSVIMKYINIDSIHYTVKAERQLKVETNQKVDVDAGL